MGKHEKTTVSANVTTESQAPVTTESQATVTTEAQATVTTEAQATVTEAKAPEAQDQFKIQREKVASLTQCLTEAKQEAAKLFAATPPDFAAIKSCMDKIASFEGLVSEARASLDAALFGPAILTLIQTAIKEGRLSPPKIPHVLMQVSFIGGEARACTPINATSATAKVSNAAANPAAAPLARAASAALGSTSADARHAPAGWTRTKNCGGQEWKITSLGAGTYRAEANGQVLQGSGNKIGSTITGKACNCYAWMDLGGEGECWSPELRRHWSPPVAG